MNVKNTKTQQKKLGKEHKQAAYRKKINMLDLIHNEGNTYLNTIPLF